MIGLDTNVLIRYLVQDEPEQARRSAEIIGSLTEDEPGFVSLVVIAEIVWVLESVYSLTASQLAGVVFRLLQSESLYLQNEQQVFAAAALLKSGRGSFADGLVGAIGAWAGCDGTLTFDRRTSRLPGFRLV